MAEQRFSVPPDPTKTVATQRASQRAERAIEQSTIRAERSEAIEHGSRAAVLRRNEQTRFSSASDDEVAGSRARSALSGAQQLNTAYFDA
jgi:hypothetical protein